MSNDLTIYDVMELPTYEPLSFSKALGDIMNEFAESFIDFGADDGKTE